jgi:hypothetical protein
MSLNLVKSNSSSPFRLQRSMVDQGGEGGAYESGGYTGESQYSDGGMSEAIAGFGKVVGAAIGSRTAGDKNKSNEKKAERLENRAKKTETKKQNALKSGDIDKADRMKARGERVEGRLKDTKSEINKYNESQKPTLKSDIATDTKAKPIESTSTAKVAEGRKESVTTNAASTSNLVDPNKTPGKDAWDMLKSQLKVLNKK